MSGITDPQEEYFKDGIWGWDGSVWRKLPLVWGYSGHYCENVNGVASGAGDAVVDGSTVPAGEVWIIEHVMANHNAGTAKRLNVVAWSGSCYTPLFDESVETAPAQRMWDGRITLPTGGKLRATVVAPGDGKKVYLHAWGYKMKVAE